VAHHVLRHRVLLNYEAEVEEISSDHVITEILEKVKVP
jgi:MoxR-like ATPase